MEDYKPLKVDELKPNYFILHMYCIGNSFYIDASEPDNSESRTRLHEFRSRRPAETFLSFTASRISKEVFELEIISKTEVETKLIYSCFNKVFVPSDVDFGNDPGEQI